jgi:hypothetical protein
MITCVISFVISDTVINLTGLIGVACLAVPAWYANKYGRLLARLHSSRTPYGGNAGRTLRLAAAHALRQLQDEWTPWKGGLLIVGTMLAGISYLLALVKALLG